MLFRSLYPPHPLFANDVDVHGIRRSPLNVEIVSGTPTEEAHHQQSGYDGPGDLQAIRGNSDGAAVRGFAAAVFKKEIDHGDEDNEERQCTKTD